MQEHTETDVPHFSALTQMRDEIRLKVHLAGLEAKSKWQEIEQQLEALEHRVAGDGGQWVDATAQLGRDIKRSLLDFKQRLSE
jgi:hypothetical protein